MAQVSRGPSDLDRTDSALSNQPETCVQIPSLSTNGWQPPSPHTNPNLLTPRTKAFLYTAKI